MPSLRAGDRVGIYSYGSGSCAEFYSVTIGAEARAAVAEARIDEQLSKRMALTVAQYEECERAVHAATCARDYTPPVDLIPSLFASRYAGQGKLVFRGTRDYYREYAWS
jgi:3-hydroxy-3-methylglutaryl CoA synthase